MKIFFVTLLALITFQLCAQESTDSLDSNSINEIYILDKYWNSKDNKKFNTDNYPSFLSIDSNMIVLFSRSRDKTFAYESRISEISMFPESEIYLRILGEENFVIPSRPTFEITGSGSDVVVHVFYTLSSADFYFKAHEASDQEIKDLFEYLNSN